MVATLLQIGLPGTQEMMIILLIAVLLFGANKIPKLARSTGEAMGEFQKGREEVEQELEEIREGPGSDEGASTEDPDSEFVETTADETASETSTTSESSTK
jgi:sec-independent protein translocase protein TatA